MVNPCARDSLIRLCERSEDVQVVAEAACGMPDAAGKLNPDLLLLNVELSDMSGFEPLRTMGGTYPLGIRWLRRAPITQLEPSRKVPLIAW